MNQKRNEVSQKRQKLSQQLDEWRHKLRSANTPEDLARYQQEHDKIRQRLNKLVAGTRAQRRTGWAHGSKAPEFL